MYFERQYVKHTIEDMEERYKELEQLLQHENKQLRGKLNEYEKGVHVGHAIAAEVEMKFLKRTMTFLKGALE